MRGITSLEKKKKKFRLDGEGAGLSGRMSFESPPRVGGKGNLAFREGAVFSRKRRKPSTVAGPGAKALLYA